MQKKAWTYGIWVALMVLPFFMVQAQHQLRAQLQWQPESHNLQVHQTLTWVNTDSLPVHHIAMLDWNHAQSDLQSPLVLRFSDEFLRAFFFAPESAKGHTFIQSIESQGQSISFERLSKQPDVLWVHLPQPAQPGQSITFALHYQLHLPHDHFSGYGVHDEQSAEMRSFLIVPAPKAQGQWLLYSDENIDDQYTDPIQYQLQWNGPDSWQVVASLPESSPGFFEGNTREPLQLRMQQQPHWETFQIGSAHIQTNIEAFQLNAVDKAVIWERILGFVSDKSGQSVQGHWWLSQAQYDKDPLYGWQEVPHWLNPFQPTFTYELKCLTAFLGRYIQRQLPLDRRQSPWLTDAIQYSWLTAYIDRLFQVQNPPARK